MGVTGRAMNDKTQARLRRARKSRVRMRTAGAVRLTVNRTPRHIYAQIINGEGNQVLAQASTLDKDLRSGATGNIEAAAAVGKFELKEKKTKKKNKTNKKRKNKIKKQTKSIISKP